MPTRAAAAREAAFISSSVNVNSPNLSVISKEVSQAETSGNSKKRKRQTLKSNEVEHVNGEIVKGGWDELPHNMGPSNGDVQVKKSEDDDKVVLPEPPKRSRRAKKVISEDDDTFGIELFEDEKLPTKTTKGSRSTRSKEGKTQQPTPDTSNHAEVDTELEDIIHNRSKKPTTGRANKSRQTGQSKKVDLSEEIQQKVDELVDGAEQVSKKAKKGKKNSYGITPGQTPFPDFLMPTPEACKEVNDLLSEKHGKVEQPATIPPPSLEVTGCGEVPSVLDALIRTRLSAATTGTNSAYAFAGLVEKYGILEEGIGKGSVNWNKVRDSKATDIEKAIKRGGLAKTKSEDIKKILDLVYEQNEARRDAFAKEKETGEACDFVGADRLTQSQKDLEIATSDQSILSLQYMHGLTADEAMTELTKFPGIGVKTASCVILFCLRRPSFAVDTHVYRLCNWLKWMPKGATRDQTFSHVEVRVPDEYKYSLHQLFIRHGKTCGRCRAATGETSEEWQDTVCPIEHLVERTGKRKGAKN